MNDLFGIHIKLGIEPIKDTDIPTFDQMREAIYRGSRDSHVIRGCLEAARYRGLSGEDTYVLLAYQALISLEIAHQRLTRMVSLTPMPRILMKGSDVPPLMRMDADGHVGPALPKLEYNEHCGACTRNKITMAVFGPSAQKTLRCTCPGWDPNSTSGLEPGPHHGRSCPLNVIAPEVPVDSCGSCGALYDVGTGHACDGDS